MWKIGSVVTRHTQFGGDSDVKLSTSAGSFASLSDTPSADASIVWEKHLGQQEGIQASRGRVSDQTFQRKEIAELAELMHATRLLCSRAELWSAVLRVPQVRPTKGANCIGSRINSRDTRPNCIRRASRWPANVPIPQAFFVCPLSSPSPIRAPPPIIGKVVAEPVIPVSCRHLRRRRELDEPKRTGEAAQVYREVHRRRVMRQSPGVSIEAVVKLDNEVSGTCLLQVA